MGNFLHLKKVAKQVFYFSKPYCKNQTKRKEKNFLLYLKLKKKKSPANHILLLGGLIFHRTLKEECGA